MSGRAARASRRSKLQAKNPRHPCWNIPERITVHTVRPPVGYYVHYAEVTPRNWFAHAERTRRYFDTICPNSLFNRREVMNVPVVYEDETENEFDIELCCGECASKAYGWSQAQFKNVLENVKKGSAIKIPDSVNSEDAFKQFVKSL